MDKKQNPQEPLKTPERRIPAGEQAIKFEAEPSIEKKEIPRDEKIVVDELRREIEKMELDENLKKEVDKKAQTIEYLGSKEKLEHLIQTARTKGLVYAVQLAKRMNEPYLLDTFHDILAREGFYQRFTRPTDDDTATDDDKKT